MKYRLCGVQIREEVVDTCGDKLHGQKAGSACVRWREWRRTVAIISNVRLALCLAELGDDLCSASWSPIRGIVLLTFKYSPTFGSFLLGYGVVSACQAGGLTVLADPSAIANALDLAAMASIAGAFDCR